MVAFFTATKWFCEKTKNETCVYFLSIQDPMNTTWAAVAAKPTLKQLSAQVY